MHDNADYDEGSSEERDLYGGEPDAEDTDEHTGQGAHDSEDTDFQDEEEAAFASEDIGVPDAETNVQRLPADTDPDVFLDVPLLKVDEIDLDVENLRAHVSLQAEVLDLLKLNVGADVALGRVRLGISGVEARAQLRVRLDNVVTIINRVLTTLDRNPEMLQELARGVGSAVQDVGGGARQAVGELGTGAGRAVEDVGRGTGSAVEDVGRGAGGAVEDVGRGAGGAVEDVGRGAGGAVEDVGRGAGSAVEGVGGRAGRAVEDVGEAASRTVGGDRGGSARSQGGTRTRRKRTEDEREPSRPARRTARRRDEPP